MSTHQAAKNASGPVTRRAANLESTALKLSSGARMTTVKTSVTELPESRVRVEAEVPAEEVERRVQQAARELGRQMRIPGFRKGKVPPPVVIRRLGRETVLDEALRSSLGGWYVDAIDERRHHARRRAASSTSATCPRQGQPLAFSIEIGVRPRAKLGDYKGLEVGRREPHVPEEAIDEELERLRDRFATLETVERAAEPGDHVVIDYVGTIDGEPFEGGEGRDQLLELGSGRLIPGLRGAARRRERRRDADRRGHLPRGLPGRRSAASRRTFEVTVKEVKAKRLPELDDEFASEAAGFDTLAELREDIARPAEGGRRARDRARVRAGRARRRRRRGADRGSRTSWSTRARTSCSSRRCRALARQGISKETYLRIAGKDEETLAHEAEPEAAEALRREAVLAAVVEAEQIEPTDEEVLEALEPAAERADDEPREAARAAALRTGGSSSSARTSRPRRRSSCSCARRSRSRVEQAKAREKLWTPGKEERPSRQLGPALDPRDS